jgi:hypothetical protein
MLCHFTHLRFVICDLDLFEVSYEKADIETVPKKHKMNAQKEASFYVAPACYGCNLKKDLLAFMNQGEYWTLKLKIPEVCTCVQR